MKMAKLIHGKLIKYSTVLMNPDKTDEFYKFFKLTIYKPSKEESIQEISGYKREEARNLVKAELNF